MDRAEVVQRLDALRRTNRAAALAPYAAHDLGTTEAAPFVSAALGRSPVSRTALAGLPRQETLARIAALPQESIYDGPSRLAQPDEVWNFGRGDGLEKCLLAANVLGGDEIRIEGGTAALIGRDGAVCSFPTDKRPRERVWNLRHYTG